MYLEKFDIIIVKFKLTKTIHLFFHTIIKMVAKAVFMTRWWDWKKTFHHELLEPDDTINSTTNSFGICRTLLVV